MAIYSIWFELISRACGAVVYAAALLHKMHEVPGSILVLRIVFLASPETLYFYLVLCNCITFQRTFLHYIHGHFCPGKPESEMSEMSVKVWRHLPTSGEFHQSLQCFQT